MSNPRRLLTTQEVATKLRISPRQVARLVPSTLVPVVKGAGPRGAYFFAEEDVQAEADRRTETVGAHPDGA